MPDPEHGRILVRRDERADGARVVYVMLSNPRKLNTLNSALMQEFTSVFEDLAKDEALRAVVLGGEGERAAIGGADIDEMAELDATTARAFITRLHRCCEVVRDLPVPAIARIHGYTLGGGLELVASCDIRIAAETAVLGMPEVRIGIPSVIEAALLPMLVGWGRTREMLYLGSNFTAKEAAGWGLVERVAPDDRLDEAVEECVSALLKSAPGAIRLQKKLIRAWEELPLGAAVAAGIDAFVAAWETDEPRREMRKFQAAREEKRKGRRSPITLLSSRARRSDPCRCGADTGPIPALDRRVPDLRSSIACCSAPGMTRT